MFQVVDPEEEKKIEEKKEKGEEVFLPVKIELPEDSVLRRLVFPHDKMSRVVTEEDINKVVEESKILYAICFEPWGGYMGAFAMHHSQIDDKDPLNFFVTAQKKIVINPVITRHSNYFVDSKEGCVTFSHNEQVMVKRWRKIEVEYLTVMVDSEDVTKFTLSGTIIENLAGKDSFIFQHECSHGEAKYIYSY